MSIVVAALYLPRRPRLAVADTEGPRACHDAMSAVFGDALAPLFERLVAVGEAAASPSAWMRWRTPGPTPTVLEEISGSVQAANAE